MGRGKYQKEAPDAAGFAKLEMPDESGEEKWCLGLRKVQVVV